MASDFTLESPEITIGVEDATTEQVREERVEARAFGVSKEASFEDVLDIGGVSSRDTSGETNGDFASKGRGAIKDFTSPKIESMAIEEDGRKTTQQWKGGKTRIGTIRRVVLPHKEEEGHSYGYEIGRAHV